MQRVSILFAAMALCATPALAQGQAHAQGGYPNRSITMVVPLPAGGTADLLCRLAAERAGSALKQQVIVENRPGGVGGRVAIEAVMRSAPDGHTVLCAPQLAYTVAHLLLKKSPLDTRTMEPVSVLAAYPLIVIARGNFPANDFPGFIAYAKANPGKVNYGSAGAGGITHLAGELLKVEAKIDIVHVPYKGAAHAVNDLLGGQVQMGIFDVPVVLPHIRSGRFKALAVTSAKRAPSLPEVPTTAEAGYPGVVSDNWYGLVAPAKTPAAVLGRVHAAAMASLKSPELLEQFAKVSGIAAPSTPQEYAAFLGEEQARWSRIITAIGFKE
jgi:tripartite-type tricarboxylate transporter receptor subunit TctC